MLASNAIPLPPKDVVARKETNGVLLFQIETDEMHFISEHAYSLFLLCDGTRTVAQIEDMLVQQQPEFASPIGRECIEHFIEELSARHLVELWR